LLITHHHDFRADFTFSSLCVNQIVLCRNGTIGHGILLCGEVKLKKSLSLKSLFPKEAHCCAPPFFRSALLSSSMQNQFEIDLKN